MNKASWAYLEYVTEQKGYVKIKEYSLTYCDNIAVFDDLSGIQAVLGNKNVTIFVKGLKLFYQVNYSTLSSAINIDKKYCFRNKYKPLYFSANGYSFRDFDELGLSSYDELKELLNNYKSINTFPKSLAGFVREDLRKIQKSAWRYTNKKIDNDKYLDDINVAYSGGDCDKKIELLKGNMYSFDINSSYPSCLYYMKYPISNWVKVSGKNIRESDTKNPYIVNCTFTDIDYNGLNCSIMTHWITEVVNPTYDDKRLKRANKVTLTCTSLDFETIQKWYDYSNVEINHIYICRCWDYLPNLTRGKIKEYYYDKEDSDDPIKKRKLNIIYGVFCQQHTLYKLEGDEKEHDEFTSPFPSTVGLFCSAYARKRLNDLLYDLKDTACYWDTDCIKGYAVNMKKVYKVIEKHNKEMRKLYNKEDTWLLGQWKDEGIHDMIIFGKKFYIKDGVPTVAGATIPDEYTNCDENTVIPNAIKNVSIDENGVKITYSDLSFNKKVLRKNNY